MSSAIILFLSSAQPPRWIHPRHGVGEGSLDQLADHHRLPVRVVVPGDAVFVSDVKLPGRQRSRQLQALPYALEELLVQEVEAYHFALGAAVGNGRHLAVAVEHKVMQGWVNTLNDAGIEAERMVPAMLALPGPDGPQEAVVAIDGQRALVRMGDFRAYEVDLHDLPTLLQLETDLQTVRLWDPDGRLAVIPGVRVTPLEGPDSLQALLADHLAEAPVNLLQGRYGGRREAGAQVSRVWRRAGLLAMGVAALAGVEQYLGYRALSQQAAALEQETREVIAQALREPPSAVNPVAARPLLEARLQALRGAGGGDGLLFLLEAVGPRLAAGAGVQLESLNFGEDGLILELMAEKLDDIETLRQRIGQETGVAVKLESASTLAEGTGARIRIGGTPG